MSTIRLACLPRPGADWRTITLVATQGKDHTILVIPGEHVLVRWIEVAGKTPQQIRAAAIAQLAPELAQPPADCISALGETRDGKRQVAIMARAAAETFLAAAHARNLKPGAIIPDICLLAPPIETDVAIAHVDGEVLVRTADAAFATQPDLLDVLLCDATRSETTLEADAARTARSTGDLPDFLPALPSARASSEDAKQPRRIAWALAAALSLAVAAPWVNAIRLDMSTRAMERQADAIAAEALPNARIRNARAQLREALLVHANGEQRIELSATLLAELAETPAITIQRLDADAETPLVRANLQIDTADDLAPLRAALAARALTLEEAASDPVNGRIPVDLTLRPRP